MIENPRQLADDHANILAARRRFRADQLLHGQSITDIIDQRGSVVESVGVGNNLSPGCLLAALVETAMQIAHLDIAMEDLLPF